MKQVKYLIIAALVTSCALPKRTTPKKKEQTRTEKLESCVDRLMSKFSVKGKIALEICEGIHKKGE